MNSRQVGVVALVFLLVFVLLVQNASIIYPTSFYVRGIAEATQVSPTTGEQYEGVMVTVDHALNKETELQGALPDSIDHIFIPNTVRRYETLVNEKGGYESFYIMLVQVSWNEDLKVWWIRDEISLHWSFPR